MPITNWPLPDFGSLEKLVGEINVTEQGSRVLFVSLGITKLENIFNRANGAIKIWDEGFGREIEGD